MTEAEQQLLELLKQRSFKEGTFKLASGAESTYYIDGKMSEVFSKGAYLIGKVLYERTKDLEFDAFGGLEVGAVPLTAAAAVHYHLNGRALEGFWVRDRQKSHGTRKLVEGGLKPGDRVVIVDDVITAGTAIRESVEIIRAAGAEPVGVALALDRQERGQGAQSAVQEVSAQFGLRCVSILTLADLIETFATTGDAVRISGEQLAALRAYQRAWGVPAVPTP
jgi:orotate phosphoribosyltransferase